ncbi:peptidase S8 [bacterium]|nr:peptidase S8 [bacterium]
MKAGLARATFGVDGSGVTVGTLSDSYDNLGGEAADVASGDLPGIGNPNGFATPVEVVKDLAAFGSDEGRAMMQLIHDVAPGAAQSFHTAFDGLADFALAIQELAGCPPGSDPAYGTTTGGAAAVPADIIVDDVIYFAEPMFQDGVIAQAVDIVKSAGVCYFSSAGNNERDGYEAPFRSAGTTGAFGGLRHDFDPGAGVDDLLDFTLGTGLTRFVFQWDEPFFSVSGAPGSAGDVDILLYTVGGAFTGIAGAAFNIGGDPVEVFGVINFGPPVVLKLGLEVFAGPLPGAVKFVMFTPSSTDFSPDTYAGVYAGTVYGHANAAGAEAVGAARYDATPVFGVDPPGIEPFSSAGPMPILFDIFGTRLASPVVRPKPEIVAPDGTNTTFFGFDYEPDGFPNFFGTSAAAPHAAALAALMKE